MEFEKIISIGEKYVENYGTNTAEAFNHEITKFCPKSINFHSTYVLRANLAALARVSPKYKLEIMDALQVIVDSSTAEKLLLEVDRKKYLSEWRKSMQYKQRKAIVRKKKSAANKNKIMENVNGNQEDTIQSYSYKNNGRRARSKQIVGQKKDTTTTTENNKKKKGRSSAPSLMTVSTDHTSTMDTCSSNGNNSMGGSTGSNVDGNQTSELSVAQLKRELHALHVTHIPKTLCTKVALSKVYETLRVSGIAYVNIEPFKTPELDGSDNDESDQENSAGEDDTTSEH